MALRSLKPATHHRLHEMMPFDEVVGLLHGVDWMETQATRKEYAMLLSVHPYYALNDPYALLEHHAQHEN